MKKTAFLSVLYEEHKPHTYEGIRLNFDDAQWGFASTEKSFFGDEFRAVEFAKKKGYRVVYSSTYDNFITDAVNAFV